MYKSIKAYDICLINSSVAEMQEKTKAVSKQASKLGLVINKNKTSDEKLNSQNSKNLR